MMFKILILTAFFIIPSVSFTQGDHDIDFKNAVKLFSEQKYSNALILFDKVIGEYSENSKTTAAMVFKVKTLLELSRIQEAKNSAIDFLNNYPSSNFLEEARILLSKIYLLEKDYQKAFSQLLIIYQDSDSYDYKTEAIIYSENVALNFLKIEELKTFYNNYKNENVKSLIMFLTAKLQINNYLYNDAVNSLDELLRLYPQSELIKEAELLKARISGAEITSDTNSTNICIMLPLSGLNSSEALTASKEILEGIKFAVSDFNNSREDKIGLLIRDTENSRDKIISIRNEIQNDASVKLVIGPAFSSEVSITLEEFSYTDIPIVSPTATDNDLTLLNENFFQANPNFVVRAKAVAQHIYFVENKRKMAVINSIEGYSPLLAAEFIKEFQRLGGNILAKYTYKSENLSTGLKIDTLELVNAEGIYIPLSDRSDAPLILSQLVQNNIDNFLYGNQDWFLARGFETSPELSNKMTFTSDYFIEFNNIAYQEFNKNFTTTTRMDANRNVLYGYDTAKYILTVLRNIDRDRRNIKVKMESGIMVNGFHNNIVFNQERVNLYLNIVRYRDGYFELIDKFKVGN